MFKEQFPQGVPEERVPTSEESESRSQENVGKEKTEETSPEKVEKRISSAENLEELFEIIDRKGGLQGTEEFFTSEDLRGLVDGVREGKLDIASLTRTEGLRNKVTEILEKEGLETEKAEKLIEEATNFMELFKALDEVEGLSGTSHRYSRDELKNSVIDFLDVMRGRSTADLKEVEIRSLLLQTITRTSGLRSKVLELLQR